MVSIRLSRGGRTHRPHYTIVAADSRRARDGRRLDCLGHYDPSAAPGSELSGVRADLIKTWLDKGASMSDTVRTLLKRNKIPLS